MSEKPFQDYYIQILQKYSIDFVRIPNQAAHGKFASSKSTAVFEEKGDQSCIKNFPDLMFCFQGKVYMREFGVKGAHNARKVKQARRMDHWHVNGGIDARTIFSMEEAREDIEDRILKDKSMEMR